MSAKRILKFGDKVKVLNWLNNNTERVKPMSADKAAKICCSEIGIQLSGNNLTGIARASELPLFTRETTVALRSGGSWHNVAACLARAIQAVHADLGTKSPEHDNLTQIIHRYHDRVKSPTE